MKKNKYVAAFLALVGGGMGFHRFYLGQSGLGIMYATLSFSMGFRLFFFLHLIDFFAFLSMDQRTFDHRYNGGARVPRSRVRQTGRKPSRPRRQPKVYDIPVKKPIRNPFRDSGLRKFKEYQIEEALEDFKKSLELEWEDIPVHFNIAASYSLLEDTEKALFHLDQAVKMGFNDFDKIMEHEALAFLRIQPEFLEYKEAGYRLDKIKKKKVNKEENNTKLLEQLNRLEELKNRGLLTEKEYVREKQKLTG